jgi:hypothetical protein
MPFQGVRDGPALMVVLMSLFRSGLITPTSSDTAGHRSGCM